MWKDPLCISLHLSLLTIGRLTVLRMPSYPVPEKQVRIECVYLKLGPRRNLLKWINIWWASVPLVSPHPYMLHVVPSGMEQPATGSCIVRTLSKGSAGLKIFIKQSTWTESSTYHINTNELLCIFFFYSFLQICCADTYFESLIRAKLEPSGPQITWAMLTSCLLDHSEPPSLILETPSHTR